MNPSRHQPLRHCADAPAPFEQQFPQQGNLLAAIYANGFAVAMHTKDSGAVKFYGITKERK